MSKFLRLSEFEAAQKKNAASVEGCHKVLSVAEFEAMYAKDKASVAGYWVSKESFFALTPLAEMTEEGAAEATYQRWLAGKRVVQSQEAIEDPAGLTEDKLDIFIECRYINLERRRHEKNTRIIEESRKRVASELMPAALQN